MKVAAYHNDIVGARDDAKRRNVADTDKFGFYFIVARAEDGRYAVVERAKRPKIG